MKKLFTFAVALATTVAAFADKPLLVGHRGSLYGVENTVESFTNGAKLGYEYLETDFKVTKDKQLVCTHDDDISRLAADGSSLTIAGSTLAELQAVPFAQTRGGVKYTGRLCSAQEYLDVCKEYNVRPLIELKWATGINSNDCSNIPMLIKFIEDNGFRDKCIILTSMKPCLEYIRKNYPDIELQFLTGQYWANHFDWCVEYGMDVDIQSGYFDKSTVTKYHDAGLKVNMWTTNTNDGYLMYGNMGCDFITTDNLDPKNLPELDPSALFPPNTIDFPETSDNVKGNYAPELAAEKNFPAALASQTIKKAITAGDSWIVLAEDASGVTSITKVDIMTGATSAAYPGADKFSDIAMTVDGYLVGTKTPAAPFGQAGGEFVLYSWASPTASPQVLLTVDNADLAGATNVKVGEKIAVSGRMIDLKVYTLVKNTDNHGIRILGINAKNGAIQKTICSADPTTALSTTWGDDITLTVTPASRDNILINSPKMVPGEYVFDWTENGKDMKFVGAFPAGATTQAATGVSYTRVGTRPYALVPTTVDGGAYTARLYNVKEGIADATPITPFLTNGIGNAATSYATTGITRFNDGIYLSLFVQGTGIETYSLYNSDDLETPQDSKFAFTTDWVNSLSNNNAPEHIDGTNAQQGTGAGGLIYVNDCVDKKLYVFDRTGCIGSLPGGAGWGCARDDKGNIVVRDDKLTGNEHSFIIYPAGATPENPGTPVTFTATVKLDGQVNFISAGGDLLGSTGHIYMFPNKQSGINIVTVENGQVIGSSEIQGLKVAGSTAGYVSPIGDNTESWLYQVRTTGIYLYNGGTNTDISTERYTTTAPGRNSTGGCAMFKMRGHQILVHNSGSNYMGGFTVKNTTNNNEVIANVAPIGNLGYITGGNSSTFNWIIPERVNPGEYRIYQYCPANGMGVYTLRDLNYEGVGEITVDGAADNSSLVLYADHNSLTIGGVAEVTDVKVFNLAGVLVAHGSSDIVNISSLSAGLYIATVNGKASAKFVKK